VSALISAAYHSGQTQRTEPLKQRVFQLIVVKRIELAGRTNVATFDPLADQNAHLSDRGDRPARHIQANAQYLHVYSASRP
jgi:hypothetical protein